MMYFLYHSIISWQPTLKSQMRQLDNEVKDKPSSFLSQYCTKSQILDDSVKLFKRLCNYCILVESTLYLYV